MSVEKPGSKEDKHLLSKEMIGRKEIISSISDGSGICMFLLIGDHNCLARGIIILIDSGKLMLGQMKQLAQLEVTSFPGLAQAYTASPC